MECRNTRQKAVILKVIKENKNHPTIADICKSVQRIDPDIGQATVYRNVKKFVEDGKIFQLKTKSGVDHYDYYKDHIHFECLNCGKIIDIVDDDLLKALKIRFENRNEDIKNYNLMLEGTCQECRGSKNEGRNN